MCTGMKKKNKRYTLMIIQSTNFSRRHKSHVQTRTVMAAAAENLPFTVLCTSCPSFLYLTQQIDLQRP